MKLQIKLTLEKPARKGGGDKYSNEEYSVSIYLPQTISRATSTKAPLNQLMMTLEA